MNDMNIITKLLGASAMGAVLLGATSEVRADLLTFENRSSTNVYFAFAEPDRSCDSGMRDHAWIGLEPYQTMDVQVDTSGRFLLGALQFIPVGNGVVQNILPARKRDYDSYWNPPTDGSSAGQCSAITPNDSDLDPNAGLWHSWHNLSGGCEQGIMGVLAAPAPGDPDNHAALQFNVVCFVNGAPTGPVPGDSGPGPE